MNHRVRGFLIASVSALAMPAATALAHCGEGLGLWHAPPGYAADFAAPIGLLGVWRTGGGDVIAPELQVPAANIACPPGVPCLVNDPGDGRSIRDFERYPFNGSLYYAFAFSDVESYEILLPGLADEPALRAQMTIQKLARNHLADFETYHDANGRRWAALFQEGVAHQQLDLDLSAAELASRVHDTPAHGVLTHLVDFELLNFAAGPQRYAALFDDADVDQLFFANLSVEEFHQTVHELRLRGIHLADVETWVDSTYQNTRFAAVFEASGGDDHLWVMACNRNSFACDAPSYADDMDDHLVSRTVKLPEDNPAVRLIDIENPRSNSDRFISSFGEGAEVAKTRAGGAPETLLDLPIAGTPPTCNHAGVLHDAGTNGPP